MDSSAQLSLPLVDINASTVEETWPLLTTAVDRADFIALDLVSLESKTLCNLLHHLVVFVINIVMAIIIYSQELSGLGLHTTKKAL